ncbi:organic hydroperoxide resistance protein [Rubrivivax gelatinosus]|nr:organic hydroperoxide resistance protein [Rubrivivax gelatinosus]
MAIEKALYTARATATGGRTGSAKADDGRLDIQLSTPKALGGDDGAGTNPEQLFAAGYAACFIGALKAVGARQKKAIPADVSIHAEVSIGPHAGKAGAFGIAVALTVNLPGFERSEAEALIAAAHEVCPYSNATRGNVDVALALA